MSGVQDKEARTLWDAADLLKLKAKQLRFEANRLDEEAKRIDERANEILDGAL